MSLKSIMGNNITKLLAYSLIIIVTLYIFYNLSKNREYFTDPAIDYSTRPGTSTDATDAASNNVPSTALIAITEPAVGAAVALSRTPIARLPVSEYLTISSSTNVPYSDPQYGNAQVLKGGSNITMSTTTLPETCTRFRWFLNGRVLSGCTTTASCNFNATNDGRTKSSSNTALTGYNSVGFGCNGKLISRFPMWFN